MKLIKPRFSAAHRSLKSNSVKWKLLRNIIALFDTFKARIGWLLVPKRNVISVNFEAKCPRKERFNYEHQTTILEWKKNDPIFAQRRKKRKLRSRHSVRDGIKIIDWKSVCFIVLHYFWSKHERSPIAIGVLFSAIGSRSAIVI